MCLDHLSDARMWRLCSASSLASSVSLQVGWGMYPPGSIRIQSLMGLPKTHCAGDRLVFGSGVLQYCTITHCTESVSRLPRGSVLLVMMRLMVLTSQLCNWSVGTQQKRVDGGCPNL